ncbi:MAG: PQQ-dependent sugar dehydrogenase, partial [Planctomycetota bacterium]
RIELDGVAFQTEAPNVFSTGTYKDGEITPGFKEDETLHTNGLFQYGNASQAGTIQLATSNVRVDESAGTASIDVIRTDGSVGEITVDYETQPTTATAGDDFTTRSGRLVFGDGVTRRSINVPIINDSQGETNEQFAITIDNVRGGGNLLAPRTATVTIVDDDLSLPSYDNFSSTAGLNLNGDARPSGNALELTRNRDFLAGSAFYQSPISLSDNRSFRTEFSFQATGGAGGADGLTFTIQNDPDGANAIGRLGGEIGFTGIENAVAVEFDTYLNDGAEVNDNHISIVQNSVTNALRTAIPSLDLNSGNRVYAWVDYNGESDSLAVYVSANATRPATALMKTNIDLEAAVGSTGYVGFTAGTGGLSNSHRIRNWVLNQDVPPLDPPTEISGEVVGVDVATGLTRPTAIDWLPNGRMLIAQQDGVVRSSQSGSVDATPFIDISSMVNGTRDRGLLDIAVHPDFASNPYVYLLFTYDPPEVNDQASGTLAGPDGRGNRAGRLIRVTADASNGYRTAVADSEVVLLGTNSTWNNFNGFANSTFDSNEPPAGERADGSYIRDFIPTDSESHSVGSLAFGTDGALFVSTGDGASYNRVDVRADRVQDIDSLSGKVLRIDPITGRGLSDNPFYNGDADANRSKVYQVGLRNPFRISVDDATGRLYVGDVGWTRWEEINSAGAGANYGWPFYEGGNGTSQVNTRYRDTPEGDAFFASNVSVDAPSYALSHSADGINAIIVGDVYRGSRYGSETQGDIFFNDLGQGIVRHGDVDAQGRVTNVRTFTDDARIVVAMREGPDGAMYYVDLDDGLVGRWELV